ncbi:MAG: dienelactone hydrolase family protein [Myxococcota bacterium]
MRVRFPSGDTLIRGELRLPSAPGTHPGVVLIPDVAGLSTIYEGFADRLAESGYVTLVLDKYSRGEKPDLSSLEAIFRFLRALPDSQVLGDVQAAIDHLAQLPETQGRAIGMTGFCVGGQYTMLAASSCRGLSAAVSWYGMLRVGALDECNPEHPLEALARLRCPLLAHFGADDAVVPLADVDELERRVRAHGWPVEVVIHAGAGHAFANPGRPDAYRAEAAEQAWRRMLEFFARHLGGGS